ncbi:MAG: prolyl oligopeptidase family serine peptidase [Bacteroidales bacterium]|nr:prolyl oligopeptidase family serine peptidase [Bacteroidales bacterium]
MPAFSRIRLAVLAGLLAAALPSQADGPKDNHPDNVRPVPPQGVAIPEKDLAELKDGLTKLRKEIDALPAALRGRPGLLELIPDVEIFHKAVRYAVEYNEFFKVNEIASGKELLKQGLQRAAELKAGKPSWTTATGLVVRGYRSKIDGSVQPYGLVVPESYRPGDSIGHRLDLWWHGRGETLSEVNFIVNAQRNPGQFTPRDAIVLHPYGRYCNANKFAGEVDTFEAIDHAKKHYRIDENRMVARGFSMGGAACWQFAVHYPTFWAAAAPGAGFSETPEFLKVFQNEPTKPEWWEERLWHWYNATDYALNISNLPTVAYSGENDSQKQAADVMARELKKVGIELTHIIGKGAKHHYTPEAKDEINRRIDAIASHAGWYPWGRAWIGFTTWTLRYNVSDIVRVEGLERHWIRSKILIIKSDASIGLDNATIKTTNISRFAFVFPPVAVTLGKQADLAIEIDSQKLIVPVPSNSDRSLELHFEKVDGKWRNRTEPIPAFVKKPGLQGPIDDAFMDKFLMVRPTGTPLNDTVGKWAAGEMKHAISHWRSQYRGDAPVKDDTAIKDADIASSHLILWGDPKSNAVLAKIADKLPVKWTSKGLVVGDKTYNPETHVPVLIYPNPLNPEKYVVLNSGFTFREYDYLNNARQVPKLPDYAVVDVTTPPSSRWPGKIVCAGFFGEKWELLPNDGK